VRVEEVGSGFRVTLSKRNLLALLSKLDWPESKRTLVAGVTPRDDNPRGFMVAVSAESDEEHYRDRIAPGEMHPRTEAAIRPPAREDDSQPT
jgi:hypothetical protein